MFWTFHRQPFPETLSNHKVSNEVRLTPGENHRVIVGEGDFHQGTIRITSPPGRRNDSKIFIGCQFPPISHILGRNKVHTIRPFHTLAEMPGQLCTVLRNLPAFNQTRLIASVIRLPAHGWVVNDHFDVTHTLPPASIVPGATVFANTIYRRNNLDVFLSW